MLLLNPVIESPETVCLEKLTINGENMRQIASDNRIKFYTAKFSEAI